MFKVGAVASALTGICNYLLKYIRTGYYLCLCVCVCVRACVRVH